MFTNFSMTLEYYIAESEFSAEAQACLKCEVGGYEAVDTDMRDCSGYFWSPSYDSSVAVWRPDASRCVTPLIVTLTYPEPSPAPELCSDLR